MTFVSSSPVFDAVLPFLARRLGTALAAVIRRSLLNDAAFTWIAAPMEEPQAALDRFYRFAGQKISFTEGTPVLIKSLRLKLVFSFDRHGEAFGFRRFPD